MSESNGSAGVVGNANGVIRIGRKGLRKFAFGEDGPVFEVDVVTAFQVWVEVDESFRPPEGGEDARRAVPIERMQDYQRASVECVEGLAGEAYAGKLSVAEAMDFLARLREAYNDLAVFFRPRSREERASPDTSEGPLAELQFSAEPGEN